MKEYVPGTYWMVTSTTGRKYITQGDKPTYLPVADSWQRSGEGMGWLGLGTPHPLRTLAKKGNQIIHSSDFEDVKFPDLDPVSIAEIEICKSGKVYIYESECLKQDKKAPERGILSYEGAGELYASSI